MQVSYKRLIEQEATIRSIVLVFLGAGVNFTIGYVVIISALAALISEPIDTLTAKASQTTVIFAMLYFLIGIIYSSCASLAFKPKRIISPFFSQIVTSSFVPILAYYIISTQHSDWTLATGTEVTFILFFTALVIFLVAGFGQERIVKYFVGLNGTKEDVTSFSLMVDGNLSSVITALKQPDVIEALEIDNRYNKRTSKQSYVFRTPSYFSRQFFISLVEDPQVYAKTQLSTISYIQTRYWIKKTGTLMEENRKNTLEDALKRAGLAFSNDDTNSSAKVQAYKYGLNVTESKLLGLKSVSVSSWIIMAGLIGLIVLATALWQLGFMTPDTYESFVVVAGISIFIDFLPLLRIKRSKFEQDDLG
jgi:hypothetical protein